MSKIRGALLAIAIVALSALPAGASVGNFDLRPAAGVEKAAGEVVVTDVFEGGYEIKEISVEASGLEPYSVYTVWLAKERPAGDFRGLGIGDHAFKTDGEGKGRFVSTLNSYDYMGYDYLQVALHPDDNPENLDNAVVALTGDLEKIW